MLFKSNPFRSTANAIKKNQREPAKKLKYPPLKSRGVLGKIGGLFKKNKAQSRSTMVKDIATPARECTSPLPDDAPTVQLRLGYNTNDHRLSTKRQSLRAAMEVQRGPSPSPLISPIKSPAWQPSPLASSSPAAEKSKIPAPTFFGPRSVSPMSTRPDSPPIAADGSNETTEMLCDKLKNQARTETNERVKNKLLDIASVRMPLFDCYFHNFSTNLTSVPPQKPGKRPRGGQLGRTCHAGCR